MGIKRSVGILLIIIQGFVSVGHTAGTDFYFGGTAGYGRNKGLGPDQVECLTPFFVNNCPDDNRILSSSIPSTITANMNYDGFMWKVYGGYRINEHFNIEGGYSNLNHAKGMGTRTLFSPVSPMNLISEIKTEFKYQVEGFLIEGVFSYLLSEKWEIQAKAGAYLWDADVEDVNQTAASNPAFLGQGTGFAIGQSFAGQLPPPLSFATLSGTANPIPFISPSEINKLFKNYVESQVKDSGTSPVVGLSLQYHLFDKISVNLEWDFYSNIGNGNVHAIGAGLQYNF